MSKACLGQHEPVLLVRRTNSQRYEIHAPTLGVSPVLLAKLSKKRSPDLVGGEQNVRFLTDRSPEVEGTYFLPALFAYRSRENDGAGQCGAGMEVQLTVLKIQNRQIQPQKSLLVESCLKDLYLDSDGSEKWIALAVVGSKVLIRWQNYPGHDGPVTGELDMVTGKLKLIDGN